MLPQTYRDRNDLLKELGYKDYQEYLASPLWEKIRQQAYKSKGDECIVCFSKAEVIHHRGYGRAVLLGTDLGPLVPLCGDCHYRVEFKEEGEKKSLKAVERTLSALLGKQKPINGGGRCMKCGKKAKKKSILCGHCSRPIEVEISGACVVCKARAATIKGNICHPCLLVTISNKKSVTPIRPTTKKPKKGISWCLCGKLKKHNKPACKKCRLASK